MLTIAGKRSMESRPLITEPDAARTVADAEQPVSPRAERRQQFRIRTELEVEILWQDESGEDRQIAAILREVSIGGCRIKVMQSLVVDLPLVVRVGRNSLSCVVSHVQPASQGYLVGLVISPTRKAERSWIA
jgi:hypothetical protein